MASLGILGSFAFLLEKVFRSNPLRFCGILLVICSFSTITFTRANVWSTEISLWEDSVNKSPLKARAHANLISLYQKEGNIEKASDHALKAALYASLDPIKDDGAVQIYNNAVAILLEKNDLVSAFTYLGKAAEIDPYDVRTNFNLGLAFMKIKNWVKAEQYLVDILKNDHTNIKAHLALALVYSEQNRWPEALAVLRHAHPFDENNITINFNIGYAALQSGLISDARSQVKILEQLGATDYSKKLETAINSK